MCLTLAFQRHCSTLGASRVKYLHLSMSFTDSLHGNDDRILPLLFYNAGKEHYKHLGGMSCVSEKTAQFSPFSRRSLWPPAKETPGEWVLTLLRNISTYNFLRKLFGPISGAGQHFNAVKINCSMLINEKPSVQMDQSETKYRVNALHCGHCWFIPV